MSRRSAAPVGVWKDLQVRSAFAHEAAVTMTAGGDEGALGAAITVELCGHWEHEPPCPLAPHHTRAERRGDELQLRTLFVVEAEHEDTVRQRIEAAIAKGRLVRPDGVVTTWQLRSVRRAEVLPAEREHADRLLRS